MARTQIEGFKIMTNKTKTNTELLEALRECLAHLQNDEVAQGVTFECCDVARAAIAKAKGKG